MSGRLTIQGSLPTSSQAVVQSVSAFGAVLYGPGSELHARAEAGQRWAMITLDQDFVARMLDGAALPREQAYGYAPTLLARAPGLAQLAREVCGLAWADPDRLPGDAVAGALAEAVLGQVAIGLGGNADRPGRAQRRQVRLVGTAVEFLEAALGNPIYSPEVSRALGVGPRAVNAAFQAVYGVRLQRYLLVRRLSLARRSLERGGGPGLIKQIALDHGFWHFGRFSAVYRARFGETPSQTLAARRGAQAARAEWAAGLQRTAGAGRRNASAAGGFACRGVPPTLSRACETAPPAGRRSPGPAGTKGPSDA